MKFPYKFQLTRLMRGVTPDLWELLMQWDISTHTPHARRDVLNVCYILIIPLFQLTRLMRGVTLWEKII